MKFDFENIFRGANKFTVVTLFEDFLSNVGDMLQLTLCCVLTVSKGSRTLWRQRIQVR